MGHKYEGLVVAFWHWLVEDGFPFNWVADMLYSYGEIDVKAVTARKRFKKYFEDTTGVSVFVKCPECKKGQLVPRLGYGYFVGCSEYPDCKFHAYPRKSEAEKEPNTIPNKKYKKPVKLV